MVSATEQGVTLKRRNLSLLTSAATQRKLPYRAIEKYCVLATVQSVREVLPGYDFEDVERDIAQGFIVAFDIRSPSARARELRILPECLDWYVPRAQNYRLRPGETNGFFKTWKLMVLKGLSQAEWLGARTVGIILNCDAQHVTELIDAGEMEQVKGTEYGVGRGNGARVIKQSFVKFLEGRLQ